MNNGLAEEKAKIQEFFARYILDHEVAEDEDVFAAGYVNSLFAVQLVLFIEDEFNITVGSGDLNINNLRTINRVAQLVERKREAGAPGQAAPETSPEPAGATASASRRA